MLSIDRLSLTCVSLWKIPLFSPNFLVWKLCGRTQFPHSFGRFAWTYAGTVSSHKNSTQGNLVKITVFLQCLGPCPVFMMERFVKIINSYRSSTIFARNFKQMFDAVLNKPLYRQNNSQSRELLHPKRMVVRRCSHETLQK